MARLVVTLLLLTTLTACADYQEAAPVDAVDITDIGDR